MCVYESCDMNVLTEQSGSRRPTNTHVHTHTPTHTCTHSLLYPLTGRERVVGSPGRIHQETLAPSSEGLSTSEGEEHVTFSVSLYLKVLEEQRAKSGCWILMV